MSILSNTSDAIVVPANPSGGEPFQRGEDATWVPMLIQYWQAAVRWRLVIAAIIAACLVGGLVLTLLTAPRYTARTQIEISREQKNVTNVEGLESREEGRDIEFYATQYSLLKANSLAERIARKLNLAKSDAFFAAYGAAPAAGADGPVDSSRAAETLRRRERQAVTLLLANVDISPIRTSRLVDIKYTSRSPELSARIANTWVQEFIGASMDRQFASTADARRFLEQRLATLRERLERSERDAVVFASSRDIVALDSIRDGDGRTISQRTLASTNLEALNQALITARAERIAAESKAKAGSAANSPELLSNVAVAQMRAKRAELAAEYAQLMVRFEPSYPAARSVRQQINVLDAALNGETSRVGRSRQLGYVEALTRERELEERVDALKSQLDRQRRDSIQYNIYQREADTNRQLYDALLQRYKEIGVAGTIGASNIAIVDQAQVPTRPSAPSLPLNLVIALFVGIALSALTVLGLEQIDEGFRSPADVAKYLEVPLLGNVPLAQDNPSGDLSDPKSHLSEAYFSIHSTLAFATTHGLPRSIAVTSTQPGEGKSTSAMAIAQIIGRTGRRVLLIDADLRAPSLHTLFKVDNAAGFANLLVGGAEVDELVRGTDKRGLFILTSGPLPPSPAELLSGERLTALLDALLQHFDNIVIDAPPVLGLADAPMIGRAVEGVVFVIEAERTPRRAVHGALQRLKAVGDHIFGAVVTKIDFSRHAYGYGYGYGYSYGYGSRYGESGPDTEMARAAE